MFFADLSNGNYTFAALGSPLNFFHVIRAFRAECRAPRFTHKYKYIRTKRARITLYNYRDINILFRIYVRCSSLCADTWMRSACAAILVYSGTLMMMSRAGSLSRELCARYIDFAAAMDTIICVCVFVCVCTHLPSRLQVVNWIFMEPLCCHKTQHTQNKSAPFKPFKSLQRTTDNVSPTMRAHFAQTTLYTTASLPIFAAAVPLLGLCRGSRKQMRFKTDEPKGDICDLERVGVCDLIYWGKDMMNTWRSTRKF